MDRFSIARGVPPPKEPEPVKFDVPLICKKEIMELFMKKNMIIDRMIRVIPTEISRMGHQTWV